MVIPLHPRTKKVLEREGITGTLEGDSCLRMIDPLSYTDFQALLLKCKRVISDSGGVMRESYFASKPCIIPRAGVWFPEIVQAGWAVATGNDFDHLAAEINRMDPPVERPPIFGDGSATKKVIHAVIQSL